MLLRKLDRKIGLTDAVAKVLSDVRDQSLITHKQRTLIAQRIFGISQGWEDVSDHIILRHDLVMQTAVGTSKPLGSSSTLSRLENKATRADAWALHGVLIEQFIASFKTPPEELTLDLDASDIPLHGEQERREFHSYYDHYCYLPLYVFCGQAGQLSSQLPH